VHQLHSLVNRHRTRDDRLFPILVEGHGRRNICFREAKQHGRTISTIAIQPPESGGLSPGFPLNRDGFDRDR